jgi:integrase
MVSDRRGRRDNAQCLAITGATRHLDRPPGHHTRIYFAFVTTAPTGLDSPATVTLHTAPLADVAFFAAGPMVFDTSRDPVPARLVLVDAMELAWQRAKYRGHQHLLLPADLGHPLPANNLGHRSLTKLCKAANVKRLTVHGLRHTSATLLLADGEPMRIVSERLGHADVSITLNVYAYALKTPQQGAANRIGALLHGIGEQTVSKTRMKRSFRPRFIGKSESWGG